LTAADRALLGGDWRLEGVVYRSASPGTGAVEEATVDTALTAEWARRAPELPLAGPALVDDVDARMLGYLACPRLRSAVVPARDSLEVRCNLR
jgi:hypothetical protein